MLKFLLVVAFVAVVTYLAIRLMQRRLPGGGSQGVRRPLPGPKPKPRMVAPDDDEDFLRDLERKRRHPEDPDTPAT
ncbi:hypothetical protein BKA08_000799 [Nocardioides marinisabuli]|uniref:Uncharacterized protein n=1 Tax=Nocardioides marinisabuli TaxID=419476 RepID=A0A7Y9EZG6_9ACTN|nr:hypothetical protein [Nocardioides marinisabuli]NYD56561.1 hypothetical protein [Nocardioides marinisabuli]